MITPPSELLAIMAECDARYPGNVDKQMEWALGILSHAITHNLLDEITLVTLRSDAHKWPESIRALLATAGGSN